MRMIERAWKPCIGAWNEPDGTRFRVWAPAHERVDVVVERSGTPGVHPLARESDGSFSALIETVRPGDRYRYLLDGERLLPDPASRFQPEGVHGASQVIDPQQFAWSDHAWTGIALEDVVFYELHVGTFSPEGTFAGATARIPELASLGITAIELMPVADFPGTRNWGYDGVSLFAPARCYGAPDDLRRLVDTAHRFGLAVFLDVVYNHLGPDGNYLSSFSPHYFTERHQTPWGAGLNFDGEHSAKVREFFIENACHWVNEYHLDGLRLDATHAIADDSPRHFLAELTSRVRAAAARPMLLVAEDHRNLNWMLKPEHENGWGLDAVWADAFHHQCRRLLAGDSEGYYRDYTGRSDDLATTISRGWFYVGQFSIHLGEPRGTDPAGISANRFVICLQNHDQTGNRALGERLHHQIDPASYRAATALLLAAPETPLLFMGQEWAASTPFPYFTDHHEELGRLVTAGRREEFRYFAAFSDPIARERIPDPQAESTFLAGRLRWDERAQEPHASTLRLYGALLALRRRERAFRDAASFYITALDESTIAVLRQHSEDAFLVVVRLRGEGSVDVPAVLGVTVDGTAPADVWEPILTTEDAAFSPDPLPPVVEDAAAGLRVRFARPAAVIFRRRPGAVLTQPELPSR